MPVKTIMTANREEIELDFTFIGFLIVENRLKPITTSIIDELHRAEVKTIMVTGDNVLTAISVARQCHIVGNHQKIFLGELSDEKIHGKYQVIWKDFEFSATTLNDDLEPELDYDTGIYDLTTADNYSPGYTNYEDGEQSPTKILKSDFDMGVIDINPPFFDLDEEFCIAMTGNFLRFPIYCHRKGILLYPL